MYDESMTQPRDIQAAVYVRISQDSEDTGLGVARQLRDCRALAEGQGWHVAEVFEDNDVSASNGKPRPAYQRMVREIEAGRIQGIIVWDVDRLTRTPRELEDVISWAERHGLHLASVGGEIDLSTPQGRMTARIKGSVARHEVEQSSRRIRRKRQELAEQGRYVGPRPYGWDFTADKGLVINEAEAAVVREAVKRILAGESIRSIVYDFNTRGTFTARGNRWQSANFRAMVKRPTNAAILTHQGKTVGPGDWPPIISREDHDRVVSLLNNPSRRTTNRGTEVKYLLTGIINCAECHEPMQGAKEHSYTASYRLADGTTKSYVRKNPDRYRCQAHGCRKVTRRMDEIDAVVSESVLAILELQGVEILGGDSAAAETARAQIEALEAKLNLAADQFADDLIASEQLQRVTAKIRPQLEAARADMERAMPAAEGLAALTGPTARQAWQDAHLEQKRVVIRSLIDAGLNISVGKAPRRKRADDAHQIYTETIRISWEAMA